MANKYEEDNDKLRSQLNEGMIDPLEAALVGPPLIRERGVSETTEHSDDEKRSQESDESELLSGLHGGGMTLRGDGPSLSLMDQLLASQVSLSLSFLCLSPSPDCVSCGASK